MWRPENWEVTRNWTNPDSEGWSRLRNQCEIESFEAGADAMLEALRRRGVKIGKGYEAWLKAGQRIRIDVIDCGYKGKLVFIPEDEE